MARGATTGRRRTPLGRRPLLVEKCLAQLQERGEDHRTKARLKSVLYAQFKEDEDDYKQLGISVVDPQKGKASAGVRHLAGHPRDEGS